MEDAEIAVVAMGSVLGSIEDVIDDLRDSGLRIGVVGVKCFRPWPLEEVRAALREVDRVVVLNRAIAVGSGSILGQDVRLTLARTDSLVYDVVAGLGGRPVTRDGIRALIEDVIADQIAPDLLHYVDLDEDRVEHELHRLDLPREAFDRLRDRHLRTAAQSRGT
jgi:pyruvate ferredoxin oxidoreductase alpha subunit